MRYLNNIIVAFATSQPITTAATTTRVSSTQPTSTGDNAFIVVTLSVLFSLASLKVFSRETYTMKSLILQMLTFCDCFECSGTGKGLSVCCG